MCTHTHTHTKNKMQGSTSFLSLIAVDHLSVFFNERYIQSLSTGVRWVDKHLSRTVGSSSKLFAWFIPPSLAFTIGQQLAWLTSLFSFFAFFFRLFIIVKTKAGCAIANDCSIAIKWRWGAADFLPFFPFRCWKTFAASSCYSTRPYRQVPLNDRKRVKSIRTYRS